MNYYYFGKCTGYKTNSCFACDHHFADATRQCLALQSGGTCVDEEAEKAFNRSMGVQNKANVSSLIENNTGEESKMTEDMINIEDTMMESIMKITAGNQGAMQALMTTLPIVEQIDPENALGGFGLLVCLDSFRIYGTDIYILFNDVCDRVPDRFITLLRAAQLGILSVSKLQEVAGDQTRTISQTLDLSDLYRQVKERLPSFDPHNFGGF